LLRGDPRKIVLARSEVTVASGNHRAPGHTPDPATLVCVHHFTWRSGVLDDLQRRVEKFSSGAWTEHTPAVRHEAARLLDHVAQHHGRINITDPFLGFRPVTLDHLPAAGPSWHGRSPPSGGHRQIGRNRNRTTAELIAATGVRRAG